jgi:succinate dehydrogenase / fumarate reductase cytochrome b subunit
LVVNSFGSPDGPRAFHTVFYVVAMFAVGFHLAHGIQSVFQSFGFNHPTYTPAIQKISTAIGIFFALAFSSIPVYFLIHGVQ